MTQRSEIDEARLEPCPFCGKPPETFGSGEGQRGLMIECATDGCVNPHVSYYEHEAAITAWNTRVSRPSPAVDVVERVARAICKSGKFETGNGTCAMLCMDQLGVARDKCPHIARIHGDLARAALSSIPSRREVLEALREPTDAMRKAGFEHCPTEYLAVWQAMIDEGIRNG